MTPEQKARVSIDALLVAAGWHVCNVANANIHASTGVAIREFPLNTGFAPQVAAGKLRVLNTWGAERLAKFPDAPTLKELGLGLVQNSPFGIGAPKGTPPAVIKRLHDAFKQAMEQESYVTALARYDMVPMYMSSANYLKFAQETFTKEKALVEKLGLLRQP